jgi:hypothetical protein
MFCLLYRLLRHASFGKREIRPPLDHPGAQTSFAGGTQHVHGEMKSSSTF